MVNKVRENLRNLELTAEDVQRENPRWTDEMVRDYVGLSEDIRRISGDFDNSRGFASASNPAFQQEVPQNDVVFISGFSGDSDGFTITSEGIRADNSTTANLEFSLSLDSTSTDSVTVEIYRNGSATGVKSSIVPVGAALLVADYRQISGSGGFDVAAGAVFSLGLSHNAGFAVTIDCVDILFTAS